MFSKINSNAKEKTTPFRVVFSFGSPVLQIRLQAGDSVAGTRRAGACSRRGDGRRCRGGALAPPAGIHGRQSLSQLR